MSHPDPPGTPTGPWAPGTYSVPLKSCCSAVLVGEECDCAEFFAEMVEAFQSPLSISWTRRGGRVEVTQ